MTELGRWERGLLQKQERRAGWPGCFLVTHLWGATGLRLFVPADLFKLFGSAPLRTIRALLTGPEPNLPALFPVREARSLTFLPGSPHPGQPEAIHRSPGPSGKFAPTRRPHANRLTPLAAGRFAELLVRGLNIVLAFSTS